MHTRVVADVYNLIIYYGDNIGFFFPRRLNLQVLNFGRARDENLHTPGIHMYLLSL